MNSNPDPTKEKKIKVRFSSGVRVDLPEEIRDRLEIDLDSVINQLDSTISAKDPATPGEEPPDVLVLRQFGGHSRKIESKLILGIEVTYHDRFERHIVKIGDRKKVQPDFEGWQTCTKGNHVASRIFAPVRMFDLGNDRVAVLYRDGFTLFGPDGDQEASHQPRMLDEATKWSVVDDKPDPISVQRALVHIFTDLGLWFYRGAKDSASLAHDFYLDHLRRTENSAADQDVFRLWTENADRQDLRRQAVWVLVGRDDPGADPVQHPARYLDPLDYVEWAMAEPKGGRLPQTLVGRSHGDLHARNVIVGDRRGEVQYPAVFDYGDMKAQNVIGWDFAKLETELKVRILTEIVQDREIRSALIARSGLRKNRSSESRVGIRSEEASRADRLAAYLAFEILLDELTRSMLSEEDVERILPPARPPTGLAKVDRLASIIARIRCEAMKWLGDKGTPRQSLWKDELHFALGVYGLINVRWNYSIQEQESALVSAGVALATMPSVPKRLKSMIEAGTTKLIDYPTYRVPLALLHAVWKDEKRRIEEGCQLGEKVALSVKNRGQLSRCTIEVLPRAYHAIPLIGHALLFETEAGNFGPVEGILEKMRDHAVEFGDFETLARIGRLYKDLGDQSSLQEQKKSDSDRDATRPPALQMYDMALGAYAVAFEATEDWYVGINAATLAVLVGKVELGQRYASSVAATCKRLLEDIKNQRTAAQERQLKKDRYWLYATEGEAALILNENALKFYRAALAELTPSQYNMADSTYKQICRLKSKLDHPEIETILKEFERSEASPFLSLNFLGRDFSGSSSPG